MNEINMVWDQRSLQEREILKRVVSIVVRASTVIDLDSLAKLFWLQPYQEAHSLTLAHAACALGYSSLLMFILSTTKNRDIIMGTEAALRNPTTALPCTPFTIACLFGQDAVVQVYMHARLVPNQTQIEQNHLRQLIAKVESRCHYAISSLLHECLEAEPESPRALWLREAMTSVLLREGTSCRILFLFFYFVLCEDAANGDSTAANQHPDERVLNNEALKIQRAFRRYRNQMQRTRSRLVKQEDPAGAPSSSSSANANMIDLTDDQAGGSMEITDNSANGSSSSSSSGLALPALSSKARAIQRAFRRYKVFVCS